MANILRDSLIALRAEFYMGCMTTTLWVASFTLLFSVGWKIGLGVWLSLLALEMRRKERKP